MSQLKIVLKITSCVIRNAMIVNLANIFELPVLNGRILIFLTFSLVKFSLNVNDIKITSEYQFY